MGNNINYYDWIPFFGAICRKITEISLDVTNREAKLLDFCKSTFQADHAILKYPTIDPFSFVYALAQRNTKNQRIETFTKAKKTFDLDIEIPTDYIFPTPTPNTLSLFYSKGNYVDKEGVVLGNVCLWNLFVQVYSGAAIDEDDFRNVLSLRNVGFTKLSQAMFLICPQAYIPFDTQMNSLPIPDLADLKNVASRIDREGIHIYMQALEKLKATFPGCEFVELNLLNVLINSTQKDRIEISNKYCQISSNIYGQNGGEYFQDFIDNNAVYTGGATTTGGSIYPLQEYTRGDVVLVRKGTKWLGGIGIVIENEYIPNGYTEADKIKIVWIVKDSRKIDGTALGQWDGFSHATSNTISKFKECYPLTFSVLDSIRKIQKVMINHSKEKYKNIILQGPPGTGKTRFAKQIAEWLTSDTEKKHSLIEAIDKNIFNKEPEIEGNEQIKLIQFHPSYTYEDFVRGVKVDAEGEKIKYSVENRILASFAEEAAKSENLSKAYVLIIDEINRANLTSVLGELIYALEYRGQSVDTIYKLSNSTNKIVLPPNLYIIGTMNTADRSVGHIDYAIRRRFAFVDVLPKKISNDSEASFAGDLFDNVTLLFTIDKYQTRSSYISEEFEPKDVALGHSYFIDSSKGNGEMRIRWRYEIKPILLEYVRDGVLKNTALNRIEEIEATL